MLYTKACYSISLIQLHLTDGGVREVKPNLNTEPQTKVWSEKFHMWMIMCSDILFFTFSGLSWTYYFLHDYFYIYFSWFIYFCLRFEKRFVLFFFIISHDFYMICFSLVIFTNDSFMFTYEFYTSNLFS